ncbi:hypothetical protein O6H91_19G058000 [Diphasiastrum complanatum]|nr:hypothetical protein O6H91_19G058000 [Diphasiastrum complanatum]
MPFIGGFQITCVSTKAREPIVEQESAGLDREEYLYAEDLHTQDVKGFAASNDNKEVKVEDLTLLELRRKLQDFARARNWDQFHSPRNLLLALVGEVGELSEIFQWKGEVQRGCPDWNPSEKEHLEEELSDVLLYLVRLADVCGVHLGQAALIKLQKNAIKYPTETRKASPSNHQSQMTSINRTSREPHQYLTGSTPNM